jgi:hypothetical protein
MFAAFFAASNSIRTLVYCIDEKINPQAALGRELAPLFEILATP